MVNSCFSRVGDNIGVDTGACRSAPRSGRRRLRTGPCWTARSSQEHASGTIGSKASAPIVVLVARCSLIIARMGDSPRPRGSHRRPVDEHLLPIAFGFRLTGRAFDAYNQDERGDRS